MCIALSLNLESLPLATLIPLVLLRTFVQTGLFIIGHDAMHGTLVAKSSKLNRGIGTAVLILYAGLNYRRCKSNHDLHHLEAETDNDPDYKSHPNHSALRWFWDFMSRYMNARPLTILISSWLILITLITSSDQQAVLYVAVFCLSLIHISEPTRPY